MRIRQPFPWFGGKHYMVKTLLPLIPDHHHYVEVFGGSGALLLGKHPSPVETYNDIDGGLVNFWRVVRAPALFEEFQRRVALTPYSREEFHHAKETWKETLDPVERAARWFVVARASFSGNFGSAWGYIVGPSRRGMAMSTSKWLSAVEGLQELHERIMRVQIEHLDWREVLQKYDASHTFFYLDPPYIAETRRAAKVYAHEMSEDDHHDLVRRLQGVEGRVLLSGYDHPIYTPLTDAGWRRQETALACRSAAKTKATGLKGEGGCARNGYRTEVLWANYHLADALEEAA